jgi:hypothetical protein
MLETNECEHVNHKLKQNIENCLCKSGFDYCLSEFPNIIYGVVTPSFKCRTERMGYVNGLCSVQDWEIVLFGLKFVWQ